eukprot:1710307-Prymnesium_polylepis.2
MALALGLRRFHRSAGAAGAVAARRWSVRERRRRGRVRLARLPVARSRLEATVRSRRGDHPARGEHVEAAAAA